MKNMLPNMEFIVKRHSALGALINIAQQIAEKP
jgi:hypothetical protein